MKTVTGHMNRGVSIIGVGCTPLGDVTKHAEILHLTEGELIAAAVMDAIDDAGITTKDIDYVALGQLAPNYLSNMANGAAMLSGWMGVKGVPGLSHDECCSSGDIGLAAAAMAVASGVHDIVLCAGVGISQSSLPNNLPRLPQFLKPQNPHMSNPNDWVNETNFSNQGVLSLDPFDAAGVQYAKTYGLTKENMWETLNNAKIQVRENGAKNPMGLLFTETMDEEAHRMGFANAHDYFNSPFNPKLGTILKAMYINSFLDGAAAVILCPTEMAKKICKKPIEIAGFGHVNAWCQDYTTIPFEANAAAAKQAYHMAGITDPSTEIDWLSIHDCTMLNYLRFTEDIGYFKPGEAYKYINAGEIGPNGKKPINTSGGRQGLGHPLAASNLVEMYEAVKQMREEAGDRQMNNAPKTCAVQSYSGGHSFAMQILRTI